MDKVEDKPAGADKTDGTTTVVGLVSPSKRGNWRFALPAAAAAAALLGPVDGQGVSLITEGYQNAAESDVSKINASAPLSVAARRFTVDSVTNAFYRQAPVMMLPQAKLDIAAALHAATTAVLFGARSTRGPSMALVAAAQLGLLSLPTCDAQEGYRNRAHGVTEDNFVCGFRGPENVATLGCTYTMARQSGFECIEIIKADGSVLPLVCADAATDDVIESPDIYLGGLLDRAADNGGELVTAYHIVAYRCMDTSCDLKARGASVLEVYVSYAANVAVVTVQPRAEDELLGTRFMVGEFTCFGKYFYYDEGATSPTFVNEFQTMPSDVDLHCTVTCPDLADDLCAGMIDSAVSTAGGSPVYLFQSDCQVSSSLYEVTSGADQQSFTFIMDPIGEVRSGGRVDHTTHVAIVPRAAVGMSAAAMSTHEGQLCRDGSLLASAAFIMQSVSNATLHRGLQEPEVGTLAFTYEVEGSGSFELWHILVITGSVIVGAVALVWRMCTGEGKAAEPATAAMTDPRTLQNVQEIKDLGGTAGFVAP